MAESNHHQAVVQALAIDHPLQLSQSIVQQFTATGIGAQINVNALLAFEHGGSHQLCAFEGMVQPRLLDPAHYYVALGTGKLSADPFLRFLVDIFCVSGPPSVAEAIFLTAWAIDHTCDTNSGGVAPPTRIAVMERQADGSYQCRALSENEVDDQGQFITSARHALRDWRESLTPPDNGEAPNENIPAPPVA